MKVSTEITVLALFTVFILVGCAYVDCNGNGTYQATAGIDGDGTVSYTLSGPSSEYRYSVFSDTDVPEKVYLYLDETYASDFNNYYIQSEFFGVMKQMLERRGCASVEYADAQKLKDVMTEYGSAVFFVSGALPDTVYNGNDSDPFCVWMDNGGTVYWTGPEIGRYVSTPSGVTDRGTGFFGGDVNTDGSVYGYTESEMFTYTGMRNDDVLYGLRVDQPDSKVLSFVSDDGYSAVSVAKLRNGNVTVFAGNIATTENVSQVLLNRTCCADLLICGLTYTSEGLDCGGGSVRGSVESSTQADVSPYSGRLFFISVGPNASDWSKGIPI